MKRIMVVEDESIVALDIRNRLNILGYEVAGVFATGEEAVDKAGEVNPDLILMDIMLKGDLDGIDTADRISEHQRVPFIYLTAYADEETLKRAQNTGPFGYIIKPFEDRELKLSIEMALYKHSLDNKLRENRRWLATTLNSIGDAVITTDRQGRVVFINPAAEMLLALDQEQAKGRGLPEVFKLKSEESGELVEVPVQEVLDRGGAMLDRQDLLLSINGRNVPISSSIAPIADEQGKSEGVVVVFRDISHRKRAERALRTSLEQLRQTLNETVSALASMGEKRDLYTSGHQTRVSLLACAIAREMGLDEDRIEGVRVAGILHDIGKIYIPAEILSKPARLTDTEMELMKSHSEVGYEILKSVSFPWPVAKMVRQHHERLDGSGYPDGLKGNDLLLEARILAVADVVEAMSSHRPYRPALGLGRALDEVSKNNGRYDEEVVKACLRLFEEDKFSFKYEGT